MTDLVLSTDRLDLRASTRDDAALVSALIGNPDVRRYLGGIVPQEQQSSAAQYYANPGKGEAMWTVLLRHSGTPIGLMTITLHKDGNAMELSYQFLPDHWRKGYAREAARAVLQDAKDRLGHPTVIAETQAANGASRHLLESLGMTEYDRLVRFGDQQVLYTT